MSMLTYRIAAHPPDRVGSGQPTPHIRPGPALHLPKQPMPTGGIDERQVLMVICQHDPNLLATRTGC
ncbi:hypothetical protein ACIBQX_46265 [Nonomuraea sp. NPDC049714]|uniref:hypothetical protein n=1 Tax=Nonomuraea sp. NPDC049714 TaxID=3364357 RepID=UPI0037B941CC